MEKKSLVEKINTLKFHLILIAVGIALDQVSKFIAVSYFTDSNGFPNYQKVKIIGDYLRFSLAYNEGAAFSSRPQDILPFLSPVVFFLLLTIIASCALVWFYRSIDKRDWLSRLGIAMIMSGAIGNFIDRMRLRKVIDFIDCDFPDFIMERFPTFNIADSFVTVGVVLLAFSPFILRKIHRELKREALEKKEKAL